MKIRSANIRFLFVVISQSTFHLSQYDSIFSVYVCVCVCFDKSIYLYSSTFICVTCKLKRIVLGNLNWILFRLKMIYIFIFCCFHPHFGSDFGQYIINKLVISYVIVLVVMVLFLVIRYDLFRLFVSEFICIICMYIIYMLLLFRSIVLITNSCF